MLAEADEPVRGHLRIVARDGYGVAAGRHRAAVDLAPGAMATVPFYDRQPSYRPLHGRRKPECEGIRQNARTTATAGIVPPLDASSASDSAVGYYILPTGSSCRGRTRSLHKCASSASAGSGSPTTGWMTPGVHAPTRQIPPGSILPTWSAGWTPSSAQGIEVLCDIFGTARWASSQPDNLTVDNDRVPYPIWGLVAPADPADWDRLVRTLAERPAWPRAELGAVERARHLLLLARQRRRLRHPHACHGVGGARGVDPDARLVLNFVDQGTPEYGLFQERVLAAASQDLDVLGWHYGTVETIAMALTLTPRAASGATLWNTEAYGVPRRLISRWLQRACGRRRTGCSRSSIHGLRRCGARSHPLGLYR